MNCESNAKCGQHLTNLILEVEGFEAECPTGHCNECDGMQSDCSVYNGRFELEVTNEDDLRSCWNSRNYVFDLKNYNNFCTDADATPGDGDGTYQLELTLGVDYSVELDSYIIFSNAQLIGEQLSLDTAVYRKEIPINYLEDNGLDCVAMLSGEHLLVPSTPSTAHCTYPESINLTYFSDDVCCCDSDINSVTISVSNVTSDNECHACDVVNESFNIPLEYSRGSNNNCIYQGAFFECIGYSFCESTTTIERSAQVRLEIGPCPYGDNQDLITINCYVAVGHGYCSDCSEERVCNSSGGGLYRNILPGQPLITVPASTVPIDCLSLVSGTYYLDNDNSIECIYPPTINVSFSGDPIPENPDDPVFVYPEGGILLGGTAIDVLNPVGGILLNGLAPNNLLDTPNNPDDPDNPDNPNNPDPNDPDLDPDNPTNFPDIETISANSISVVLSGGLNNKYPDKSLGGEPSSYPIISGNLNNLFRDLGSEEFLSTAFEDYRCFYVFNDSDNTIYNMKVWIIEEVFGGANIEFGVKANNELQRITIFGTPTSGTITFSYENNQFISNISSNIDTWAINLQNQLNKLPTLNNVSVLGQKLDDQIFFNIDFGGEDGLRSHDVIQHISNTNNLQVITTVVNSGNPINSLADLIENENIPPTDVGFYKPLTNSPILLPKLMPSEGFPIWAKRQIGIGKSIIKDGFTFRIQASLNLKGTTVGTGGSGSGTGGGTGSNNNRTGSGVLLIGGNSIVVLNSGALYLGGTSAISFVGECEPCDIDFSYIFNSTNVGDTINNPCCGCADVENNSDACPPYGKLTITGYIPKFVECEDGCNDNLNQNNFIDLNGIHLVEKPATGGCTLIKNIPVYCNNELLCNKQISVELKSTTISVTIPGFDPSTPGITCDLLKDNDKYCCNKTFTQTFTSSSSEILNISLQLLCNIGDYIVELTSEANCDNIVDWSWDFGDGTTSKLENPIHAYQEADCYDIALTVTDADGCETTTSQEVCLEEVDNNECFILDFSYRFAVPDDAGDCRYTFTPIVEDCASIGWYSWSFGTGANPSAAHNSGQDVSSRLRFPEEGCQDVTLRVWCTTKNCEISITKTVCCIENGECSACFGPIGSPGSWSCVGEAYMGNGHLAQQVRCITRYSDGTTSNDPYGSPILRWSWTGRRFDWSVLSGEFTGGYRSGGLSGRIMFPEGYFPNCNDVDGIYSRGVVPAEGPWESNTCTGPLPGEDVNLTDWSNASVRIEQFEDGYNFIVSGVTAVETCSTTWNGTHFCPPVDDPNTPNN